MSAQFYPALHACLQREQANLQRDLGVTVAPTTPMWNSGVVGLPRAAMEVLDQSLRLCDALFLRCYQREWLKQLALSIVFQGHRVATCEAELAHYWGYADEATPFIRDLLCRGRNGGTLTFAPIDPAELETRSRAVQRTPSNRRRQAIKRLRRSYRKRLQHVRVAIDTRFGRV